MLITGGWALYFAEITNDNWQLTFFVIGIIFAVSTIFIITVKEKELVREKIKFTSIASWIYTELVLLKIFLKENLL